jgi:hypothetical protein
VHCSSFFFQSNERGRAVTSLDRLYSWLSLIEKSILHLICAFVRSEISLPFFVLSHTDFPQLNSVLLPVGFGFTSAPGLVHSRSDPVCCFVGLQNPSFSLQLQFSASVVQFLCLQLAWSWHSADLKHCLLLRPFSPDGRASRSPLGKFSGPCASLVPPTSFVLAAVPCDFSTCFSQ